jgi:hypothetical protein
MAVSFFGLILLLLVGAALVGGILLGMKSLSGFRLGHTMLNCPHCRAETPATGETCKSCGQTL